MAEPPPPKSSATTPSKRMLLIVLLLGAAGAALCITLFARHGFADVLQAVKAAGWGVAAVVAFHLVPMFFDVVSWRALIPRVNRLSVPRLFWIRWIGDSVSAMLPVAQVGGEVVRVRLSAIYGMPAPIAAASVLVGMTVSVATQIVFTLSGLFVLVVISGKSGLTGPIIVASVIGLAAVAGFFAVQHLGIFRIIGAIISHVMKAEEWKGLVERGAALDQQVREMYRQVAAVVECTLWTFCNWAMGAVEVWIALWALGAHTTGLHGYAQAYAMESMSQGIRSAAFLVPGALGVQEGGYLVVGAMLGLSPETALALALIRRVRELAFGLPGVMAWPWAEGRRLFSAPRRAQGPREGIPADA